MSRLPDQLTMTITLLTGRYIFKYSQSFDFCVKFGSYLMKKCIISVALFSV